MSCGEFVLCSRQTKFVRPVRGLSPKSHQQQLASDDVCGHNRQRDSHNTCLSAHSFIQPRACYVRVYLPYVSRLQDWLDFAESAGFAAVYQDTKGKQVSREARPREGGKRCREDGALLTRCAVRIAVEETLSLNMLQHSCLHRADVLSGLLAYLSSLFSLCCVIPLFAGCVHDTLQAHQV